MHTLTRWNAIERNGEMLSPEFSRSPSSSSSLRWFILFDVECGPKTKKQEKKRSQPLSSKVTFKIKLVPWVPNLAKYIT